MEPRANQLKPSYRRALAAPVHPNATGTGKVALDAVAQVTPIPLEPLEPRQAARCSTTRKPLNCGCPESPSPNQSWNRNTPEFTAPDSCRIRGSSNVLCSNCIWARNHCAESTHAHAVATCCLGLRPVCVGSTSQEPRKISEFCQFLAKCLGIFGPREYVLRAAQGFCLEASGWVQD